MTTKKLHLAYISGNPVFTADSPSGYSTRMREVCGAFEKLGYQTSIHVPEILHQLVQNTQKPSRKWIKSWIPHFFWQFLKDVYRFYLDRCFSIRLAEKFRTNPPDIIYECLEHSGSVTARLRKQHARPFVLEIHGPLQEDAKLTAGLRPLQFLFNMKLRRCLRAADALIVISGVVKTWLMEDCKVSAEKILVEPNGVNLELFNTESPVGKPSSPVIIGFVGSDLSWHRLDALLEAIRFLKTKNPFELHIVGVAYKNPQLLKYVQEHGLQDRVKFPGSAPFQDIPRILANFHIGVMAGSNRYGSPIKLFEYAASRLAVIAPDEVPVREIFEHEKDILMVPSGNVPQLIAALTRLVDNAEDRARLSLAIHQKVMRHYTWSAIVSRIDKHIQAHVCN